MKHRTAGFPLFFFFLILTSFSSVSPDNSTPSLSLEGTWKIYFGPEIPPEAFRVDFNDRQWKDIEMPGAFIQAAPGKAGYAWLRKSFSLKGRLASIPLALFIGRIAVADEVYWNGVRIGRMGRMPPAGQELTDNFFSAWNSPRLYEIPSNLIEPDVNTEIVIKIYYSNDGWIQDNMEIGSAGALRPRVRLRAFLLNDLNMILAFVLVSVAL